jgi:hypothetical protein
MATYYLTITPINTLSTSTYSIYFNSIAPSNLIASGVPQSTLTGVGYPIDNTGRTSAIVKNEDPDCCCDAQSFVFPTPSPTATPTTTPTSQPTTATPTTQPTTPNPTTPNPTTPNPTTPNPTTPNPTTPNPTTPQPTSALAVTGVFGYMEPCLGGSLDDHMGAGVSVNSAVSVDTTFGVDVKYVQPGNSCLNQNSTQGFSITIFAGQTSSTFDACNNGAYFPAGVVICSACVASCDNPAVTLTGYTC